MRTTDHIEKYRITSGSMASSEDMGPNGVFLIPGKFGGIMECIASNELLWEHVSVCFTKKQRVLSWEEMQYVKEIFWNDEEAVMQIHPPKSQYVNLHPYVLHLWRPEGIGFALPPVWLV